MALVGKIIGNIGFVDLSARREDERASLQRVRSHRGVAPECLPRVPFLQSRSRMQRERPWKYGNMDLLAEPDHCRSHKGHEVLATNQAAETPDVGVKYPEIGRVALTPKQPLSEGWHGFAVTTHQSPIAVEKEQRVVDCGHLWTRIHLVTSHHDVGSSLARGSTQPFGVFAWGDDRSIPKADATSSPLLERTVPAFGPIGIAGEPHFRKDDEV